MKTITIITLVAALLAGGCTGNNTATVHGSATGIAEGTAVYLVSAGSELIDSTAVAGGKFEITVAEAYPDVAYLVFGGYEREPFMFFLEPGKIKAQANFETTPQQATITGTPSNKVMTALNRELAAYNTRLRETEPRLIELYGQGTGEGNPEYDSLMAVHDAVSVEIEEYIDRMAAQNLNTTFAAYMMYSGASMLSTPEQLDSVLNLIAGAPANAFTDRLTQRRDALAVTAVGQLAPDFTQNQADGTPFTLSSLRGQVVLIDFWASWCVPCRVANPQVVGMYNKYHGEGFEIVGVSLDNSREEWLAGIVEDSLPWVHVSGFEPEDIANRYSVFAIPYTVLLDRSGVIVATNLRGSALEQAVAETLGVEVIAD